MLKLSVHILTYNSEKFISECLDSILEQKTSFLFDIVVYEYMKLLLFFVYQSGIVYTKETK